MFWRRRRPADPSRATEDDIRMCFRLLLGRAPNPEELRGHFDQAGQDLSRVVASYLNSLEFARRGLLSQHSSEPEIAQADGFRIYAAADDLLVGTHVLHGNYEPEVAAVFRSELRTGMTVVDIGANIGYFSMLSAALVGPSGAVLAIEPNPDNARLLEQSRKLNGFEHVTIAAVAAGAKIGLLVLHTSFTNGTTSAVPHGFGGLASGRVVPSLAVDGLIAATWPPSRRIDLIKVDVEGAEYLALSGAEQVIRRDRPVILSEFSPTAMPGISGIGAADFLRWLHGLGYGIAVLQQNASPLEAGQSVAAVMDAYERYGADHVDLMLRPL